MSSHLDQDFVHTWCKGVKAVSIFGYEIYAGIDDLAFIISVAVTTIYLSLY
jgi:hypothetical protein